MTTDLCDSQCSIKLWQLADQILAAAATSHMEALAQAIEDGAPLDTCDKDGFSALWHAAHRGHVEGVRVQPKASPL